MPILFCLAQNRFARQMQHIFTAFSLLSILLAGVLLLSACSLGPGEGAATHTAQAKRSVQQATRLAQEQRSTQEINNQRATGRALEAMQQATLDVIAHQTATQVAGIQQTATKEALNAQSTADAQAFAALLSAAHQWPALVADSFDKPAYEWPQGKDPLSNGSLNARLAGGKYFWEVQAERGFTFWSNPTEQPVGDLYLSVEMRQTGGAPEAEAGLVFHSSEQSFWCFLLSGEGSLFIGKLIDGSWGFSLPLGSSHIQTGQVNHLAILAQDNRYTFLINDFSLMVISDDQLPSGPAGLMFSVGDSTQEAAWEFDNFELRLPP